MTPPDDIFSTPYGRRHRRAAMLLGMAGALGVPPLIERPVYRRPTSSLTQTQRDAKSAKRKQSDASKRRNRP